MPYVEKLGEKKERFIYNKDTKKDRLIYKKVYNTQMCRLNK